MAAWLLDCPECGREFVLAEAVAKAAAAASAETSEHPVKPSFPSSGLQLECPNCNKSSVFWSFHLRYQA